jgi:hypothetical protein
MIHPRNYLPVLLGDLKRSVQQLAKNQNKKEQLLEEWVSQNISTILHSITETFEESLAHGFKRNTLDLYFSTLLSEVPSLFPYLTHHMRLLTSGCASCISRGG